MDALATRQRASGALLIVGSVLGLAGNALHPHAASADASAALLLIADNGAWSAIHLTIIVAAVAYLPTGVLGIAMLAARA
jgi:hypothetical protein